MQQERGTGSVGEPVTHVRLLGGGGERGGGVV